MIYQIHIHSYWDSKYILYHIHLYQSILCIHTCIYHHSSVAYYYKRLYLVYIYTYTFHAIFSVLFLGIVTTTAALTCFNTERTKYRLIIININNFWSYFIILDYSLKYNSTELHLIDLYLTDLHMIKLLIPPKIPL